MKNVLIALGIIFLILWVSASSSCIWIRGDAKGSLILLFEKGVLPEELIGLTNDLKKTYPDLIVEKSLTEEGAFNEAVAVHNIKPENIEQYKKTLTSPYDSLPRAEIDIKASPKSLGSEETFRNFLLSESNKYKSLIITTNSGSGGDRIARFFEDSNYDKKLCISPKRAFGIMSIVLLNR